MKKTPPRVLLQACLLAILGATAAAQTPMVPPSPGSRDLIERPLLWDGKEIVFEGEAIGDPLRRGDHAWANLLDANAAIGVWMPAADVTTIGSWGSYRGRGDTVRVRGIFNRACADHGGDMDIHAKTVIILGRGAATVHPVHRVFLFALPPALGLALFLFLFWKRREAAQRPHRPSVAAGRESR